MLLREMTGTPSVVANVWVKSPLLGTLWAARPQSSFRDPAPRACPAPRPAARPAPHRLLRVLEDLAGLLVRAGLLPALSLQVSLLHLLQERVGPAGSLQDTVGLVPGQEHWGGRTRLSRVRHVATHRLRERRARPLPRARSRRGSPPRAEPQNSAFLEAAGPAPPGHPSALSGAQPCPFIPVSQA